MMLKNRILCRESFLAGLTAVYGLLMLVVTPPFQVADEFNHYARAYQISELEVWGKAEGDKAGGKLPAEVVREFGGFSHLCAQYDAKTSLEELRQLWRKSSRMPSSETSPRVFTGFSNTVIYAPAPYLFSSTGIAFSRAFGWKIFTSFYAARLCNLLGVSLLLWVSFRLLRFSPGLQLLMFLVAGMPMTSFQLMSVSVDALTIMAACLTTAVIMRIHFQWDQRLFYLLLIACAFLGLCKQAYVLLPAISLICLGGMPGRWKIKALGVLTVGAATLTPMVLWSLSVQSIYIPHYIPRLVKEGNIDPPAQLLYFLSNMGTLVPFFLNVLIDNWQNYLDSFFGVLGWLDTPLGRVDSYAYFALYLLAVVVGCRNSEGIPELSLPGRAIMLTVVMGSVLFVELVMYLSWNPVGKVVLDGIQGRYFIPLAPAFLIALYGFPKIRLPEKAWQLLVMLPVLLVWGVVSCRTIKALVLRYWW